MSDPFLVSSGDEAPPAPRGFTSSFYDMLREAGVPQEHIDEFEARRERWEHLVDDVRLALESAGFRRHEPTGRGGGFWVCWHLRDDGLLVTWAIPNDGTEEFDARIARVMHPALRAVLIECGFAAEMVPEDDEDDGGSILVTGRA